MRRNLGAAIDGRDPEGVHAMRVASRRLRAALEVFGPWLDKRAVGPAGRSLRRVTRALGRVRELDVLRLRLAKLSADAGPARKLAIEIVDSRIARRRVRARARMIKTFGSIDLDQLDTRLREIAGAPPAWAVAGREGSGLDAGIPWHNPVDEGDPDEPMETLIERLAPRAADAAHRIVETSIPGDTGSREASRALHDVRIQAKKLRYQLEIIAPHRGDEAARLVRTLKGLQEHLGDFHDDSVLDVVLADNMTRQAARARPLLVAELRELRLARQEALRRDEAACRRSLEELRAVGFAPAIREVVSTPPTTVEVPAAATDAPREPADASSTTDRPATTTAREPKDPRKPLALEPAESMTEPAMGPADSLTGAAPGPAESMTGPTPGHPESTTGPTRGPAEAATGPTLRRAEATTLATLDDDDPGKRSTPAPAEPRTPPVTLRPDPPRSTPPASPSAEQPETHPASEFARRTAPPSEPRPDRSPHGRSSRESGGYAGEPIRTPSAHEPRDDTARSAKAAAATGPGTPAARPKT